MMPTSASEATVPERFFDFLAKECQLTPGDEKQALEFQQKYGGKIAQILIVMGLATEEQVANCYARYYQIDYVELSEVENYLSHFEINTDVINKLNLDFLKRHKWAYLGDAQQKAAFIAVDPFNSDVIQYFDLIGLDYRCDICLENVFREILAKNLGVEEQQFEGIAFDSDVDTDKLVAMASEAPVVNLVNSLISRGVQRKASDMHIEPHKGMCRVRLRIDGVLQDLEFLPQNYYLPVVSRIKILSGMDIAEKRRPQDGKISTRVAAQELDIRVSVLPLNDGESVVMRFLIKQAVKYELDALGISQDIRNNLEQDLQRTAGVILLTGPTGSGKTTTLYSFLNQLNDESVKIITLEDPVEYQLEGVNQIQVNSEIGFDFARGLRSIVRQDPDTIMLGEIRDKETAQIAMQSSLTGHLVFSTVHTNDAPSAFTRLLDLGVEEFLLNASIVSIVAQRLARTNCSECAEELCPEEQERLIQQYDLVALAERYNGGQITLKQGKGCRNCNFSGFKGRTALIEYLRCDDAIKEMPKESGFTQQAHQHMKRLNIRSLYEDGLYKVIRGITTVSEVVRVAG